MPRGLGDSPLKREKKARRASAQAVTVNGVSSSAPESTSYVSTEVSGSESVHASSSGSRSYNDVFFQRRPENSGAAANGIHEEVHADDSSATAPIAAPLTTPALTLPEVATSALLEPAQADVLAAAPAIAPSMFSEPAPETNIAPEYVPEANVAPEHVEAPPANGTAHPQPSSETSSSQEAKSGFFGRIFGRLRK